MYAEMEMDMKRYGLSVMVSILLCLSVAGCTSQGSGITKSEEYTQSSMYSVGNAQIEGTVTAIHVHTTESNVEFVPSEGGQITLEDRVEGSTSALPEEQQLHFYLDGLTLRVEEYGSGVDVTGAPQKTVVIRIPYGTSYYVVRTKSSSGNVSMSGMIIDQLTVETTGGDVELKDMTARSLKANTTAGNVAVEDVLSSLIETETTAGNTEITLNSQPYRLEAETGSGEVQLKLPETPGFELTLEQAAGEFEDGFGLTKQTSDDGGNVYTTGTGENKYKVTTESGSVVVEKAK